MRPRQETMELPDHQTVSFLLKLFPEVRMCNGDHGFDSLIQRQMAEADGAILRYDVVCNVSLDRDHCTRGQRGNDPGDGTMLCGGGQRNDTLSTLGMECTIGIVRGNAGAGKLGAAQI